MRRRMQLEPRPTDLERALQAFEEPMGRGDQNHPRAGNRPVKGPPGSGEVDGELASPGHDLLTPIRKQPVYSRRAVPVLGEGIDLAQDAWEGPRVWLDV